MRSARNDWKNHRVLMATAALQMEEFREKKKKEKGEQTKMDTNGNNTTKQPTFEIFENNTVRFKLLQDKPKIGTSSRGPWWLFSVEFKGEKQSFFAPKEVVDWIEKNDCKKGDEIEATLTHDEIMPDVPNYKLVKVKDNTYKPTIPVEEVHKDNNFELMRISLKQAIALQTELGSVVDVNRIGLSLFIQRSKSY